MEKDNYGENRSRTNIKKNLILLYLRSYVHGYDVYALENIYKLAAFNLKSTLVVTLWYVKHKCILMTDALNELFNFVSVTLRPIISFRTRLL